jgi:hypothetical protein
VTRGREIDADADADADTERSRGLPWRRSEYVRRHRDARRSAQVYR